MYPSRKKLAHLKVGIEESLMNGSFTKWSGSKDPDQQGVVRKPGEKMEY